MFFKLPILDSLFLRGQAIGYFKDRFPQYEHLNLKLNFEGLIIDASPCEYLGDIIRELWKINKLAAFAIGTSYVSLEVNGCEKLRVENMVATIDAVETNIENGSTNTFAVEAKLPYGMPKGIKLLTSLDEVAAFGRMSAADLVNCLDEEVQINYKINNREQVEAIANRIDLNELGITLDEVLQIIPVRGLSNEVGIDPENINATVAWYWLYKGVEAFATIPQNAQDSIAKLKDSPIGQYLGKPDAANTRRSKKAAPTPTENTSLEEDATPSNGTRNPVFRGAKNIVNDTEAMDLLLANKFTKFTEKVLATQKTKSSDRTAEMIEAGAAGNDSWKNFFAPILKAALENIPESDREKVAKKINSLMTSTFKRLLGKTEVPA